MLFSLTSLSPLLEFPMLSISRTVTMYFSFLSVDKQLIIPIFKKSRETGEKESDNVVVGLVLTKRTRRRVHKRITCFTRRSPARGHILILARVCNLSPGAQRNETFYPSFARTRSHLNSS